MKTTIVLLGALTMAGCVSGYNPTYYFNEVQVHNLSGDTIENVSLRVLESPKALSCAAVNRNAMCDDRFGKRRYPQQGIELSWTHPDGSSKSETFSPHVPVYFSSAFPLRIVMEIDPEGSVNPFYEQEEPGDGGLIPTRLGAPIMGGTTKQAY